MNTDARLPLPVYSVALASAAAIAYEVLLVRWFSIIQWHHFAYMIISLALLGYGASGSFLSVVQQRLLPRFRAMFVASLALFGVGCLAATLFAQAIPFNPEELAFAPTQWFYLAGMYLLLSVPFFFVALAIGLALTRFASRAARVYAFDLVGAGSGSLLIVFLLNDMQPATVLRIIAMLGVGSAILAVRELDLRLRMQARLALTCMLAVPLFSPADWLQPQLSPYKDLSQALRVGGAYVETRLSSPLGMLSVLASPRIPLRHAPGLSLNALSEPPPQRGLFTDGHGPSAITSAVSDPLRLDYLDQLGSALPYHLGSLAPVLVLGVGGGDAVLQALQLGTGRVDAVELNPRVIELLQSRYAAYTGGRFNQPRLHLLNTEARAFVSGTTQRYALITIPLSDSAGSGGLYSMNEDYLDTVQAYAQFLGQLLPGGYLAINHWVRNPPRDTLKAVATVAAALRQLGAADIARRVVLIRGWQTSTLLVKNGPYAPEELSAVREFCTRRSFDLAYLPDMRDDEANRFNLLREPYYYQATRQLLGATAEHFIDDYKFNLQPATDDQPYFHRFFRWRTLPEIVGLAGRGGVALMDMGYLVLLAALLQAVAASVLLILLPLLFTRPAQVKDAGGRARVLVYFTMLGLAFLFVEIGFMQKLTLFLHHPVYAFAVTLAAFLIFAGLGSAYSQRLSQAARATSASAWLPVLGIVALVLLYLGLADALFAQCTHWSTAARVAISVTVIAPLAFCMGMPFPLGLARLGRHSPDLLPWAWAVNGCASVLSSILATLLVMHLGISAVIAAAVPLYLLAGLSFPRPAVPPV